QLAHHIDRWRLAHIVCARLEGKAEDRDPLAVQGSTQRLLHLDHESPSLLQVDLGGGLQQPERMAVEARHLVERGDVLGKARSPKAKTGVQKSATDARVGPEAIGDRVDVTTDQLTQAGQLVDE